MATAPQATQVPTRGARLQRTHHTVLMGPVATVVHPAIAAAASTPTSNAADIFGGGIPGGGSFTIGTPSLRARCRRRRGVAVLTVAAPPPTGSHLSTGQDPAAGIAPSTSPSSAQYQSSPDPASQAAAALPVGALAGVPYRTAPGMLFLGLALGIAATGPAQAPAEGSSGAPSGDPPAAVVPSGTAAGPPAGGPAVPLGAAAGMPGAGSAEVPTAVGTAAEGAPRGVVFHTSGTTPPSTSVGPSADAVAQRGATGPGRGPSAAGGGGPGGGGRSGGGGGRVRVRGRRLGMQQQQNQLQQQKAAPEAAALAGGLPQHGKGAAASGDRSAVSTSRPAVSDAASADPRVVRELAYVRQEVVQLRTLLAVQEQRDRELRNQLSNVLDLLRTGAAPYLNGATPAVPTIVSSPPPAPRAAPPAAVGLSVATLAAAGVPTANQGAKAVPPNSTTTTTTAAAAVSHVESAGTSTTPLWDEQLQAELRLLLSQELSAASAAAPTTAATADAAQPHNPIRNPGPLAASAAITAAVADALIGAATAHPGAFGASTTSGDARASSGTARAVVAETSQAAAEATPAAIRVAASNIGTPAVTNTSGVTVPAPAPSPSSCSALASCATTAADVAAAAEPVVGSQSAGPDATAHAAVPASGALASKALEALVETAAGGSGGANASAVLIPDLQAELAALMVSELKGPAALADTSTVLVPALQAELAALMVSELRTAAAPVVETAPSAATAIGPAAPAVLAPLSSSDADAAPPASSPATTAAGSDSATASSAATPASNDLVEPFAPVAVDSLQAELTRLMLAELQQGPADGAAGPAELPAAAARRQSSAEPPIAVVAARSGLGTTAVEESRNGSLLTGLPGGAGGIGGDVPSVSELLQQIRTVAAATADLARTAAASGTPLPADLLRLLNEPLPAVSALTSPQPQLADTTATAGRRVNETQVAVRAAAGRGRGASGSALEQRTAAGVAGRGRGRGLGRGSGRGGDIDPAAAAAAPRAAAPSLLTAPVKEPAELTPEQLQAFRMHPSHMFEGLPRLPSERPAAQRPQPVVQSVDSQPVPGLALPPPRPVAKTR